MGKVPLAQLTETEWGFLRWVSRHPEAAGDLALLILRDADGLFPEKLKSLIRRATQNQLGVLVLRKFIGKEAAERLTATLEEAIQKAEGGTRDGG